MFLNKKLTKVAVLLLIALLVASALLFKTFSDTYEQINNIHAYQEKFDNYNELSKNITLMTSNLQDYIIFADQKFLDEYIKYSSLVKKKQPHLFTQENSPDGQKIIDLIETSKSYMSFATLEVIPTVQSQNYRKNDINYLYTRNKEFAADIRNKLNVISESSAIQLNNYFNKVVLNTDSKIILLLLVLLTTLLFLPYVIYLLFKPFVSKSLYISELAENIDCAFLFIDKNGVVRYINKSAQDLFGLLPETVLEKNLEQFPEIFPWLQNVTQPLLHTLLRQKESLRNRVILNSDDRAIKLTVDYVPVYIMNKIIGAMMVARLASEQKDKPLLLDTLEKERKRISIEIHDWIARYMSTIIHSLDYNLRLQNNGNLKSDDLMQSMLNLRDHCQTAAIEMRGIMNDIHPYLIDKVGLISALESYTNTYEKLNNIKVYILYQDRSLRIKKKDEIIIYRIIQEALSNIVKHAKATEVDINFTALQDNLKIEILDNGGIEGDFIAGKGLWGMKERANLIGGDIVFGTYETGFSVTLTVPILPGGQQNE